jgi:hypothetical protein
MNRKAHPRAASRALQAATSPEARSLRPVQACTGRLGAAVLSPLKGATLADRQSRIGGVLGEDLSVLEGVCS